MRFFILASVIAVFSTASVSADHVLIPREHHEWGRFPKTSWKKVRVVIEKLNGQGKVISSNSNEITTTVIGVTNDAVQLQVETVVEVAGKHFNKQPQVVNQGFGGEANPDAQDGQRLVRHVGTDDVVIDGRTLESEVRTVTVRRDQRRWTSRIYYCRNVAPYILRREISSHDASGEQTQFETSVEVTALEMPHEVGGVIRPTSHVRTETTTPKGKTITLEVRCEDVPGGFISHTSKQLDTQGRLVGRSTLELVEYYVPASARRVSRPTTPQTTTTRWPYRRWGR